MKVKQAVKKVTELVAIKIATGDANVLVFDISV